MQTVIPLYIYKLCNTLSICDVGNAQSAAISSTRLVLIKPAKPSSISIKFLFYRATWNGVGFFKNYANNLKSVYNSGERDIDKLICADLTFRYNKKASSFKPGVSKMAYMIDYKKPQ